VRARTPDRSVAGVIDEKGSSVAEAFVFAYSTAVPNIYASDRTDEDGGFGLEDLGGSETYTVLARKPGYMERKATNVKVNSRDIQVVLLKAAASMAGIVSASGNPIETIRDLHRRTLRRRRGAFRPTQDNWTEFRDPLGEFLKTDSSRSDPARRTGERQRDQPDGWDRGPFWRDRGMGDIPSAPVPAWWGRWFSRTASRCLERASTRSRAPWSRKAWRRAPVRSLMADGEGSFLLDKPDTRREINLGGQV